MSVFMKPADREEEDSGGEAMEDAEDQPIADGRGGLQGTEHTQPTHSNLDLVTGRDT